MTKRFSDDELFELRNFVPIGSLIEYALKIPCKMSEGYFRFLCPHCNEFQTAINSKTNLARCFLCEVNFNTIEMVMTYLNKGFVDSVKYLKSHRQAIKNFSDNRFIHSNVECSDPLSIGAILKGLPEKI